MTQCPLYSNITSYQVHYGVSYERRNTMKCAVTMTNTQDGEQALTTVTLEKTGFPSSHPQQVCSCRYISNDAHLIFWGSGSGSVGERDITGPSLQRRTFKTKTQKRKEKDDDYPPPMSILYDANRREFN